MRFPFICYVRFNGLQGAIWGPNNIKIRAQHASTFWSHFGWKVTLSRPRYFKGGVVEIVLWGNVTTLRSKTTRPSPPPWNCWSEAMYAQLVKTRQDFDVPKHKNNNKNDNRKHRLLTLRRHTFCYKNRCFGQECVDQFWHVWATFREAFWRVFGGKLDDAPVYMALYSAPRLS